MRRRTSVDFYGSLSGCIDAIDLTTSTCFRVRERFDNGVLKKPKTEMLSGFQAMGPDRALFYNIHYQNDKIIERHEGNHR